MDDPRAADLEAVALLNEPARRRLYDWVAAQPEAVGRDEAAAAVGITRSLAAFHLERLAPACSTPSTGGSPDGRPRAGRPAKLYRRSSRDVEVSVPARRYGFAADLFARALEAGGAERLEDVAHDTGERLARDSRPPGHAGRRPPVGPRCGRLRTAGRGRRHDPPAQLSVPRARRRASRPGLR